MEQTIEKLTKQVQELEGERFKAELEFHTFEAAEDLRPTGEIYDYPPPGELFRPLKAGAFWGSEDGYLWLRCQVSVPVQKAGYKLAGYFDFNSIHEGYASGFEAMLYINGAPWQGIDENHQIIILEAFAGLEIELMFKLWMGITGGPKSIIYHQIKAGAIGYLSTVIEEYCLLAGLVLNQAQTFSLRAPQAVVLIKLLNESAGCLNWVANDPNVLRESTLEALIYLKEQLKAYASPPLYTIHCIGHTHIDLAWMWQVKNTKEKAMRSFSTALRLMEEFPQFQFYQSTPQLYDYIQKESPALFEQIKMAVKRGQWEAGGAMWVEADCNLPNGESLVRQIMYGKQYIKQTFGVDTNYVWLPDVFGFTWSLPQILKKSGVKYLMTSKLSWNKQNRFPYDTFLWQGPDGSEVTAYFLTTPADGFPTQEWAVTYNGGITPGALKGAYELYQQKEQNNDLMMTYGHGDGGGGCTREMILKIDAMKQVPFGPGIQFNQPSAFFELLDHRLKEERLPVYADELYLEYHRGTFTSQARVKRENRQCENLLRDVEFLLVYEGVNRGLPMTEVKDIAPVWKMLLKNQFHDIIPGSSIQEVYEDAHKDYDWIKSRLQEALQEIIHQEGDEITIVNTSNWPRNMLVTAKAPKEGQAWVTSAGTILQWERLAGEEVLLWLPQTEAFGIVHIRPESKVTNAEVKMPLSYVDIEKRVWETPDYVLCWNEYGQISRCFDKQTEAEVLKPGQAGNAMIVFEDKPRLFDAWDIDSYYQEKAYPVQLKKTEIMENSSLRTVVRFDYQFQNSMICQDIIIEKENRQILFKTKIEWNERQCLLKTYFPINVHTQETVFDIQFGNIKRATTKNNQVEAAKFEVCGHRFVDVSQRDRGAGILNDCKYGMDVSGTTIGLTLLKSAVDPDRHADEGTHEMTYALYPHKGGWYEGEVNQAAFMLNHPPLLLEGCYFEDGKPLLHIDGAGIEVDSVKRAEDGNGFIVRFHEYGGGSTAFSLISPYMIKGFCSCDLMEVKETDWCTEEIIVGCLSPYEIKTYRIRL